MCHRHAVRCRVKDLLEVRGVKEGVWNWVIVRKAVGIHIVTYTPENAINMDSIESSWVS